ncbi:MAG: hypothetical protein KGQ51_12565 [Planctomycetes bacterium]|nr:hypothetical protein [Planctomycetota bacterium]
MSPSQSLEAILQSKRQRISKGRCCVARDVFPSASHKQVLSQDWLLYSHQFFSTQSRSFKMPKIVRQLMVFHSMILVMLLASRRAAAQQWSDTVLPVSLTVGCTIRLIDLNRGNRLDIAIVDSKRVFLRPPCNHGPTRQSTSRYL